MYAEGKAMAEIAKDLNDQGLRTLKGGPFTINGLRHILQNDRYIGVYRYSDITIPDGMPPIVERETFDKAQEQLALNKRQGSQRANGIGKDDAPRYWLTGKLYCGMCGNTMHGVHGTGKHGDKYYYACKNRLKHKCQKRNVRKEDIEALVVSVLREILHDDENTVSIAADISAYYKKNYVDTSYLDSLRSELRQTEKAMDNLIRALKNGLPYTESIGARVTENEERKKGLAEAIEAEGIRTKAAQDKSSIRTFFKKYSNADFDDEETRNTILEYFVDRIYVYDDHIFVVGWFTDLPQELTGYDLHDSHDVPDGESGYEYGFHFSEFVRKGFDSRWGHLTRR